MNFTLGFMAQNEIHWLKAHLPLYLDSGAFDSVVAVDGGSTDGTVDYLESVGVKVYHRPFDYHWGNQADFLVQCCEREGGDIFLRIDPDETLFGADMHRIRAFLEAQNALVVLSRIHFIGDRHHYRPEWTPDPQYRAWRLGQGVTYGGGAVHEMPNLPGLQTVHLNDIYLYHYAYLASADERDYRTALYEAVRCGDPLPKREDYHGRVLNIPRVPYTGTQPLDPSIVGARAPFGDEP